jgi:predicted nucleic acid-binding protein
VDRIFLDANVHFSAANREDAGLIRLWDFTSVELVTSSYAAEEARRNLDTASQRERLAKLLEGVRVIPVEPLMKVPPDIMLPEKDVPILRSAMASGCTHLLTGDVKHFGPYFGQVIGGVLISRAAAYFKARE